MHALESFVIRAWCTAAVIAASLACAPAPDAESAEQAPAQVQSRRADLIDPVVPARDAVVSSPTRFEWTPVEGADSYFIIVVSEVDVEMFEAAGITQAAIDVPADVKFDFGTYFWRVVAVKGDKPIAESGRSAFVVLR